MSNPIGEIVLSGNLLIALPIALLAGLISFASPCILPLVPGYLGYVGGFTGDTAQDADPRRSRRRLVAGVTLFILGFTVVFVAFGVVFGVAGLLLNQGLDLIMRIAGVVLIIMGLVFIGSISRMQRTVRPGWRVATGLGGAPLLGIVFGLGWTPCVGPTLIAVSALSLDSGSPWRAAILAIAYCLGLGVPFLLVALGIGWAAGTIDWVKRNIRVVNIVGGAILIALGALMVSGLWRAWMSALGAVIVGFVTPL